MGTVCDLAQFNAGTGTTTVVDHRVYDSFGNLVSQTNAAVDFLFGFTGRPEDEATGLQNNLNRWYDAGTGRWMSEDPTGFTAGDTNLSRYCGNSPTNVTDPTGQIWWIAIGAGVVAVGIAAAALPDWAAISLTADQQALVDGLIADINKFGDAEIRKRMSAVTVTGIFKPGWGVQDGPCSETRKGRFFGLNATRTILSNDFFARSRESQLRTLLHESYHAATGDFTEVSSYPYAEDALNRLKAAGLVVGGGAGG